MPTTKVKVPTKVKNLSNNSMIAGLMILCMLALVASFLISKELLGDIRFNSKVLNRKNTAKVTLEKNVSVLDELKQNFEVLQKDGPQPNQVLAALPLDADYPGLAAQYETMASVAGARLVSISLQGTNATTAGTEAGAAPSSGVQTVDFQVSATGSYASLQKLLASIEKSQRPTKVVHVGLSGSEPTVSAEFTLQTYYQPAASVELQKETIH